jgi:cobalt-zinc-cadmium efflux system outer membrane protein
MRRAASQCGVIAVILLWAVASRAEPLRLSVDDAVARAIAANLELMASRTDVSVAKANLERGRALLPSNPQFTAGAQHLDGFALNYTFSLSQEFEVAGQRGARVQAAQKEVDKATWEVKSVEQTLAATAKTAFVHALISIDRVTVARQAIDATADLNRNHAEAEASSDAQRIQRNQTRIQAIRDRRALAWTEQTRDNAFAALRRLLGLPAGQDLVLTGAPQTEVRELPSAATLTRRALDRRSDLIALRHAAQQTDLRVSLTRREGIPNVTLSGTFGRFESANFAGGDITVPIPVFQRKAPDTQEALAEYEKTSLQVQNLEREIAKEVGEARQTCILAGDDLHAQQRQIVPMSEENLAAERRLYDRGEADLNDLAGVQADLLEARRGYLDALEAYNNALIELERVSGGSLTAE